MNRRFQGVTGGDSHPLGLGVPRSPAPTHLSISSERERETGERAEGVTVTPCHPLGGDLRAPAATVFAGLGFTWGEVHDELLDVPVEADYPASAYDTED